jgi:beta-galactosidase/beta-glucuronidase
MKSLRLRFGGVDDNGVVFINGHKVISHQGWNMPFDAPLHPYVKPGDNLVAVYVQNVDGPGGIWQPVELQSNSGADHLAKLSFHPKLAGEIAGWHLPHFDDGTWETQSLADNNNPTDITWSRAKFNLPDTKGWDVQWSLEMQATCSAQIWLNGILVGRFFPEGPQTQFYLPGCWLKNGAEQNTLVLVMRPSKDGSTPPKLQSLRVAAYTEYSPKVDRMEIVL